MSIDAFNTGAARARRDMSDPFFTTYNRTDDSHRVQDILTAIAYLEGRPDVARVNLAGVGKGGLWCLLARALAPQLHRTLVDVSRFSSEEDQAYLEHLYVPVLRRAGDFKTASMLAPATRLLIHNTGDSFDTGWFRQAYELAGKTDLLEIEPAELLPGTSPCLADPKGSLRPLRILGSGQACGGSDLPGIRRPAGCSGAPGLF